MSYSVQDFDDWNWNDSPLSNESSNEGFITQGMNSLFGVVREVADVKRYWEGDFGQDPYSTMNGMGYTQTGMLNTVEHEQNLSKGGAGVKQWYENPMYIAGGIAAAGLLYLVVAK